MCAVWKLSPTRKPSVPIMAIPTTAGTAAEVTINYVITDEEKRRKFVCVDPHDIPQAAFIDADMMDGMPPALKAATGVDALTHAIEGYITRAAWALTDALHIKAIEIIAGALRGAVAGEKRPVRRWRWGNTLPGWGFQCGAGAWDGASVGRVLQHATRRRECYFASACDAFQCRVYQREIP